MVAHTSVTSRVPIEGADQNVGLTDFGVVATRATV